MDFRLLLAVVLSLVPVSAAAADRPLFWIDACEGEPAEYARIVEDLGTARVVYLGERHTLQRHHDTQAELIADLAHDGTALVVALEPLESSQQPGIDRFNRGEIDFDGLAVAIDWAKRWPNYKQYRPVLEAARKAKAPVIGLSPGPEVSARSSAPAASTGSTRRSASNSPQKWISTIRSMKNSSRPR